MNTRKTKSFSVVGARDFFLALRTLLAASRWKRIAPILPLVLVTGCAALANSEEPNPPAAKTGCGYVDFYTTSTSAIYAWILEWNIDDYQRKSSPLYDKAHRSGGLGFGSVDKFIRVECTPVRHEFQISARMSAKGEKGYSWLTESDPGWSRSIVQVDVRDGMITPVKIQFDKVLSRQSAKMLTDIKFGVAYDVYTYKPTSVRTVEAKISASVESPIVYQKKEAMPYFPKD